MMGGGCPRMDLMESEQLSLPTSFSAPLQAKRVHICLSETHSWFRAVQTAGHFPDTVGHQEMG